ncbi:MAG: hypothetical protein ACRERX_20345 [Pseudomonas sp.]
MSPVDRDDKVFAFQDDWPRPFGSPLFADWHCLLQKEENERNVQQHSGEPESLVLARATTGEEVLKTISPVCPLRRAA